MQCVILTLFPGDARVPHASRLQGHGAEDDGEAGDAGERKAIENVHASTNGALVNIPYKISRTSDTGVTQLP